MTFTKDDIIDILKTVLDPEVHLIYNIEVTGKKVAILMTYTTPFCPWGPQLNDEIITTLKDPLGATEVDITLTFDPPYKMTEDLRAMLGI